MAGQRSYLKNWPVRAVSGKGDTTSGDGEFWEHTIRDEHHLQAHFDYIHYNPVKHGLVQSPGDWLWSSFHRYVRLGYYTPDMGCVGRNP